MRRLLEFCRTVPTIVFALIFVVAFGLGPLPGVLALALPTAGALGKLFTEVVENADLKPAEGVKAAGATLVEVIRFGLLPKVPSNFASYTLLRFEFNLRDATVMGFVGAGGIGDELMIAIRRFYYSDVSAMLVLIILTVFAMDLVSEQIRKRLTGGLAALWRFVALMVPPSPNGHAGLLVEAWLETLAIALLGSLTATVLALPFGFLAARNAVGNEAVHFLVRRLLDTIRSIDTLVWALMWIAVVGLGPFAGVLAIASSDFGALGKLFSETIEAAGARPVEGIRATGAKRMLEIRLGLLPQVLPVIAGQVLYFFESNTRSATIIGIVGAGGIGLHVYEAIRTFEWQEVSFAVLLILAVVALIDAVSGRLRAAMRSQLVGD